jgi:hypothetical protein
MEIQDWYVAIDSQGELVAMFLSEDDRDRFIYAKEMMTVEKYTKDVYKLQLKR